MHSLGTRISTIVLAARCLFSRIMRLRLFRRDLRRAAKPGGVVARNLRWGGTDALASEVRAPSAAALGDLAIARLVNWWLTALPGRCRVAARPDRPGSWCGEAPARGRSSSARLSFALSLIGTAEAAGRQPPKQVIRFETNNARGRPLPCHRVLPGHDRLASASAGGKLRV